MNKKQAQQKQNKTNKLKEYALRNSSRMAAAFPCFFLFLSLTSVYKMNKMKRKKNQKKTPGKKKGLAGVPPTCVAIISKCSNWLVFQGMTTFIYMQGCTHTALSFYTRCQNADVTTWVVQEAKLIAIQTLSMM